MGAGAGGGAHLGGSKLGGNYTPPAILRAVANAAKNKGGDGAAVAAPEAAARAAKADWAGAYTRPLFSST
jgi:hypothetical protein